MPASSNRSWPPARLASRDLPRGPELWHPEQTLWTEDNTDGLFYTQIIESYLKLTKGPKRGQQVRLRHWQADTICDIFRLNEETGRRQYRVGLFGVARKNSKSLLGAGLGLAGLLDEQGAEVYSAAGDKEQARLVFKEAKEAVEMDAELKEILKVYKDAIECPANGSVWRVLSAEAFTKEGLNPSLVLFDEVHVQPNDELWDVMSLGSGTREQPLVLGITTAGARTDTFGNDSLCYRLYQHGKKVLSGEEDDPTFFFRWYEPEDPNADHHDPALWLQANPAINDFLYAADFESVIKRTRESEFRTKRLNLWVSSNETWLPHGAWDACAEQVHVEDGADVVLGFDGSFDGDSTVLVGCTVPTADDPKPHLFVVEAWEKPANDDDWRVDIKGVEDRIVAACKQWHVLSVACDPYRWQRTMQALEAEGLPVAEYPTTSIARMVPACAKFFDAVIDEKVTHDGDPRLARHIENARVKTDSRGPRIVKEHKHSRRHIDLAVAAVAAHDIATGKFDEPPPPPLEPFAFYG